MEKKKKNEKWKTEKKRKKVPGLLACVRSACRIQYDGMVLLLVYSPCCITRYIVQCSTYLSVSHVVLWPNIELVSVSSMKTQRGHWALGVLDVDGRRVPMCRKNALMWRTHTKYNRNVRKRKEDFRMHISKQRPLHSRTYLYNWLSCAYTRQSDYLLQQQ